MKQLIFDLDDTILMSDTYVDYNDINFNHTLFKLLNHIPNKKFLYTNGTYGHGHDSLKSLQLLGMFQDIFARDSLMCMKPSHLSFNLVNNLIIHNHNGYTDSDDFIFFDDLLENLFTAKKMGWETVWIHPQCDENRKLFFIDYAYPDIESALNDMKNKAF
jgi:putative hydrolase of the HAD superfamily